MRPPTSSPEGPARLGQAGRLPPGQPPSPQPVRPGLLCSHPVALTHDGQGSGLAQLVPHGVNDLEIAPIQVAAVDGVVSGADPVEFAFREVNSQAWKRGVSLLEDLAPELGSQSLTPLGCSPPGLDTLYV